MTLRKRRQFQYEIIDKVFHHLKWTVLLMGLQKFCFYRTQNRFVIRQFHLLCTSMGDAREGI